ncbi:hypothetical protein TWF103_006720 [Orbilia oligospora]|nr:hypothetical protein TWF103_006720 [Orbilia oligospora]
MLLIITVIKASCRIDTEHCDANTVIVTRTLPWAGNQQSNCCCLWPFDRRMVDIWSTSRSARPSHMLAVSRTQIVFRPYLNA